MICVRCVQAMVVICAGLVVTGRVDFGLEVGFIELYMGLL